MNTDRSGQRDLCIAPGNVIKLNIVQSALYVIRNLLIGTWSEKQNIIKENNNKVCAQINNKCKEEVKRPKISLTFISSTK